MTKINQTKFRKAIEKEIRNNLSIGAYTILSQEESARIRQEQPEKVMESRYVLTAKEIEIDEVEETKAAGLLLDWEGEEPCKAKARHVMKGLFRDRLREHRNCHTTGDERRSLAGCTTYSQSSLEDWFHGLYSSVHVR